MKKLTLNNMQRLSQLKAEVRAKYKADIKGLFGSYVKGTQHKSSDIDILVDFLNGADLFDFIALAQFLEETLDCSVDVVPINDIRLELREVILREAIYI